MSKAIFWAGAAVLGFLLWEQGSLPVMLSPAEEYARNHERKMREMWG